MKTRRFDFTERVFSITSSIETIGSIPNSQSYDSLTGEYTPDFSLKNKYGEGLFPVIFQPHVYANAQGSSESNEVTDQLTNVQWKWIEISKTGEKTTINLPNSSIDAIVGESNRLIVMQNVKQNCQVAVVFTAQYKYGSSVYNVQLTENIWLTEITAVNPVLTIDRPTATLWHPCRDDYNFTVNARLMQGDKDVLASNRSFVWQKHRGNGVWTEIGAEEYDDFGWEVSSDTVTFKQDMRYMGDKLEMRVVSKYKGHEVIDNTSPVCNFSLVRRIPEYDYDFINVPENIEDGTRYIRPKAVIQDKRGVINNPDKEFLIRWSQARSITAGNPTFVDAGIGEEVALSTEYMKSTGAMIVGIDVQDRKAYMAVTDDRGDYLVDDSGNVVFDR